MSTKRGTLNGELGLIGLFDLGQLLQLNGATGRLAVTFEGRTGYLYFEGGNIINAVDDRHQEGELAAYRLFEIQRGRFEFSAESPGAARLIQTSTEGLMLEAARRIDEAQGDDADGIGLIERLRQRQGAMEALREAFQNVAHEARDERAEAATPVDPMIAYLREADDRLLFAPGRPPRLRHRGMWRSIADETLDATAYAETKGAVLDGAEVYGGNAGPGEVHFRTQHADGELHLAVSVLGEGDLEQTWIQRIHLPPPAFDRLDGPAERLQAHLDETQAITIVAATTAEAADWILHAIVAERLRRHGGTALIASDVPVFAHETKHGVAMWAGGARLGNIARAAAPTIVALPHGRGFPGPDAQIILATPVIVASVLASDGVHAVSRWLATLPSEAIAGTRSLLAGTPIAVLHSEGLPEGDAAVQFVLRDGGDGAARPAPTNLAA